MLSHKVRGLSFMAGLAFVLLVFVFVLDAGASNGYNQEGSYTFAETGKSLRGRFLDYWLANGGLRQFGYPISDEMLEKSNTDGEERIVQYFERAMFESHHENQPPHDVLLSLLGSARYMQKYPQGAPDEHPNTDAGSVLFPVTGKRLGGQFLKYWNAHGGLSQFGYPISNEFFETSGLNGKLYPVQYFQRAVFEYHAEYASPNNVLLAHLGVFRYKATYSLAPDFKEIRARIARIWHGYDTAYQPVGTPVPSPTSEALDREYSRQITALSNDLKGRAVREWQGWVMSVQQEKQSSTYLVTVDMDEFYEWKEMLSFVYGEESRNPYSDVVLYGLSPVVAKQVSKGQKVVFNGTVDGLRGRSSGVTADPANGGLILAVTEGSVMPVSTDAPPPLSQADLEDVVITWSRPNPGFSSLASYDLTIYGSGRVEYREETGSYMQPGPPFTKTYQVDISKVRELLAAFEKIEYFNLKDSYTAYNVTDAQAVVTSLTLNTHRKSIFHYYGDRSAPAELAALEETIDRIVDWPPPATEPLSSPKVKWKIWLGGQCKLLFNKTLYCLDYETLRALDTQIGRVIWSFKQKGLWRGKGVPVATGDTILLSAPDETSYPATASQLYVLDAATGEEKWRLRVEDGEITEPVVVDDTVYFGTGQSRDESATGEGYPHGHIYAVDLATGTVNWSLVMPDSNIWVKPDVYDGVIYFAESKRSFSKEVFVSAVDLQTRQEQWRFALTNSHFDHGAGPVTVRDGVVYFTLHDTFYAVDAETGHEKWHHTDSLGRYATTFSLDNRIIYTAMYAQSLSDNKHRPDAAEHNSVVALDASTGEQKWRYTIWECCIPGAPFVVGSSVYFSGSRIDGYYNDSVYALDAATGKAKWRFSLDKATINGAPVADDRNVYFSGDYGGDDSLYAVEAP